jgi:nucleotide-binding universal stress UspA family protein
MPEPARSPAPESAAAFADILCAVNGSRGSQIAAEQAIALAKPGATIRFIAVWYSAGTGLAATAQLSERRARNALTKCTGQAERAGVSATVELRKSRSATNALLSESESHDLLVLGSIGSSRASGIMMGSSATQAAHRTLKPLLIARRAKSSEEFPMKVLLASDGSPGSWAAARATSRIARGCGSQVEMIHVPSDTDPKRRRRIDQQIAAIREVTGVEPMVTVGAGQIAGQIVETARKGNFTLLAIGHRGVSGARALGSVSERVAHQVPCSVLVVPLENQD